MSKTYLQCSNEKGNVNYGTRRSKENRRWDDELPDEELNQVVGGYNKYDQFVCYKYYDGAFGKNRYEVYKRYEWEGGDINWKYFCPNCGRFVHKGSLGLFYCDPCNESWFLEDWLVPNLDAWVFKEIREQRSGDAEDLPAL